MVLKTKDVYKEIFNEWHLRCCNAQLPLTDTLFPVWSTTRGNTVIAQLPPFRLSVLILPSAGCRGISGASLWLFSDSMALVTAAAEGWTEKQRKVPEGADKGVLNKKWAKWISSWSNEFGFPNEGKVILQDKCICTEGCQSSCVTKWWENTPQFWMLNMWLMHQFVLVLHDCLDPLSHSLIMHTCA